LISYCKKCGWKIVTPREIVVACPRCESVPRSDRIRQAVARDKRLREWVVLFRISGEQGLGDTVDRLQTIAGNRQIKVDLDRLMKVCGCDPQDAIEKLNEQYPYKLD